MAALFSRSGNDFIHGREQATQVTLKFSAPHKPLTVEFRKRRDKSPVWTINGEEYTKAGKLGPRDIFKDHGIYEYETRNGRHNLFYQEQLEQLFILRLPSTQVYEIFSQIFERNNVRPAVQQTAAAVRQTKQAVTFAEGGLRASSRSLEACRAKLSRLDGLPDLQTLDLVEGLANKIEDAQEWLEALVEAEANVVVQARGIGAVDDAGFQSGEDFREVHDDRRGTKLFEDLGLHARRGAELPAFEIIETCDRARGRQ